MENIERKKNEVEKVELINCFYPERFQTYEMLVKNPYEKSEDTRKEGGSFRTRSFNSTTIYNKKATIYIMNRKLGGKEYTAKGVAKCNDNDVFDKKTGQRIAFLRARMKLDKMEINYLSQLNNEEE